MEKAQRKTLFCYEVKKIVGRKVVWISMVVAMLLSVFTVGGQLLGNYYVNGEMVSSK